MRNHRKRVVIDHPKLDLVKHVVPLLRKWLRQGVSDGVLASSARVSDFRPLGGGLKSDLVANVELRLITAIKLGEDELFEHYAMMNKVNERLAALAEPPRGLQKAVFCECLCVQDFPDSKRSPAVMLMQSLDGYRSLEYGLYEGSSKGAVLRQVLRRAIAAVQFVHSTPRSGRWRPRGVSVTADPFGERIARLLTEGLVQDQALQGMRQCGGKVLGFDCPPLHELLRTLRRWSARNAEHVAPCLVHGDCHAGNILYRRRGVRVSTRLIDPNPRVGYSDPAYDYGKLLHLFDPVGWAKAQPTLCRAGWTPPTASRGWRLDASHVRAPVARESVRRELAVMVERAAAQALRANDPSWRERYHVAAASAHLGLLPRMGEQRQRGPARFVLAHALAHLVRWKELAS